MISLGNYKGNPHVIIDSIDGVQYYHDFYCAERAHKFEIHMSNYLKINLDNKEKFTISDFVDSINEADFKRFVELAIMLVQKEKNSFGLVDIAMKLDEMSSSKANKLHSTILDGLIVLINPKGGFNYVNSIQDIEYFYTYDQPYEKKNTNDNLVRIKQFIFDGMIKSEALNIDADILVIENDQDISPVVKSYIDKEEGKKVQVITEFNKVLMTTGDKWDDIFKVALHNGLKKIVFETTGNNKEQLQLLITLIKRHWTLVPSDFVIVSNYDIKSLLWTNDLLMRFESF